MECQSTLGLVEFRSAERSQNRQTQYEPSRMTVGVAGSVDVIDATTGQIYMVQLFLATLTGSSRAYLKLLVDPNVSSWIAAHIEAFELFEGVPDILDCLQRRGGIARACRTNSAMSRSYTEMADHYGASIAFTVQSAVCASSDWARASRALMANIKGKVGDAKFQSLLEFDEYVDQMRIGSDCAEKLASRPLPTDQYVFAAWKECGVGIDYHVELEKNFYSVPFMLRNERLWLRCTSDTVDIYSGNAEIKVASHARSYRTRVYKTVAQHMPSTQTPAIEVEWSPDTFLYEARSIGISTALLMKSLLSSKTFPEHAFRSCMGILKLCEKYGAVRVEAAAKRTISMDRYSLAAIRKVLEVGSDAAFHIR